MALAARRVGIFMRFSCIFFATVLVVGARGNAFVLFIIVEKHPVGTSCSLAVVFQYSSGHQVATCSASNVLPLVLLAVSSFRACAPIRP